MRRLPSALVCFFTLLSGLASYRAQACCAVAPPGQSAVNADQSVILLWDKQRQTEHFIRQASFRGEGNSVGFIVPTPSRPQLAESGNAAFPYLDGITAPSEGKSIVMPLGCAARPSPRNAGSVQVIGRKTVAGFDAVVLTADSGEALVGWLKDHGYAYTAEAAEWAHPYLTQHWYMTAMKIAKSTRGQTDRTLAASALRITFHTEHPLFPYREPDSRRDATKLGINDRLLRIYFVAESRYEGRFPKAKSAWEADTAWSDSLATDQRATLLQQLGLPASTGPAKFWLTKFDHHWPYGKAPGDVYFQPAANQQIITQSGSTTDISFALALGLVLVRKRRRLITVAT